MNMTITTASTTRIKADCGFRGVCLAYVPMYCTIVAIVASNLSSCTSQSEELYDTVQGVVRQNPKSCKTQFKEL